MPLDDLPGALILPTRDDIRDKALRDYSLRNPGALVTEKTQPYLVASMLSDVLVPVYGDAALIAANVSSANKTGAALIAEAAKLGTAQLPASGASGFVYAQTSSAGGTIFSGDEIRDVNSTGLRFQCAQTALYVNGQPVPIIGIDTGPSTNLKAGLALQWTSPRPGVAPQAVIIANGDGSGLTGGRNAESEADLNARLIALRSNPPASGNDAELQAAVLQTPGVFAQQAFTYPAINSSGTTAIAFTLRPSASGGNRIPNSTHLAAVQGYVASQFPADLAIFMLSIVASPVSVALSISWASGAVGWADSVTWPPAATPFVVVSTSTSPTAFQLSTSATIADPVAGQNIATYDAAFGKFRRKRILSVTGTNPWAVVVDGTNSVSDLVYKPVVGQMVCPWSDSLQGIVPSVVGYFDSLGPGEQISARVDPSIRQRRSPVSPQYWPASITNRLVGPLFSLSSVQDVTLLAPAVPYQPSDGTLRVSVNMLTLGGLAVFP